MNSYTPYHIHSDYSLLDSCTKFDDYIKLAVRDGAKAIASTEHGKPLGWVSKKLMCDEAGIKFIHGVEIYLTEQLEPKVRDNYHTVLLAKNLDGVHELNRLIGVSSDEEHFYYSNRISFDEFLQISGNVIKTSACLASPLNRLGREHPRYMELARHYDYLEVQPHMCDDQVRYNRKLFELSKELGKPLIAGTDTHNASKYKEECRGVLMSYKGQSYGDEDAFDLTWKTYDELKSMFNTQGALLEEAVIDALENTNRMAESVSDFELDRSIKYPILYGSYERDAEIFEERVWQMLDDKLASGIIPKHQEHAFRDAIVEEIRVFKKLNMMGFMLSMSELMTWCKENGMAIGTARGSVGGSRVAYVSDIIDLNPETWNTVFSRFANEDRLEIGDIDVDCVESDRPSIFKHIINRFGEDKTARVGSFGTIAELGVIDTIGGALKKRWEKNHSEETSSENPWNLRKIDSIKKEYAENAQSTKDRYPDLFYFFDGMLGTKVSQSVHPAGMVISPLNLHEEYGTFHKDGCNCLLIDMEELHEVGAAKYDFLVLKTVQVIRDTCRMIGKPYPRTHEIDWNDEKVWKSMWDNTTCIFQFEGTYAGQSLSKFKPMSVNDMALVTACIRPSGASYRDELLARKIHKNPSNEIDVLLKDNLGFCIFQEDTLRFLQDICGLSGSEADNVRRAIGRKQRDRLEKALPSILDGYCANSSQSREVAEKEANEFLRIIEDSANYQFGRNHSIAYCLLGYLCAYYRYYYPIEFITAYLNDAANDDDIQNGQKLAQVLKIKITSPKFGISRSDYACNAEDRVIAKGVSSIKYIGTKLADQLLELSKSKKYTSFVELLSDMRGAVDIDSRQLGILIHIDFFDMFGNQRELENIVRFWEMFKEGEAKQISKSKVDGSFVEDIVKRHSTDKTKTGKEAANYKLLDTKAIILDCEKKILGIGIPDCGLITKVRRFKEAMGYVGYISGKDEDRPKLYVKNVIPLKRKRDGKQFGYSIQTQSIGSGIESRFTVYNADYVLHPINKDDIIKVLNWRRERGQYFAIYAYRHIRSDDDVMDELEEEC